MADDLELSQRDRRRDLLKGRASVRFPGRGADYWDYRLRQEEAAIEEEFCSDDEVDMGRPSVAPSAKRRRQSVHPSGGAPGACSREELRRATESLHLAQQRLQDTERRAERDRARLEVRVRELETDLNCLQEEGDRTRDEIREAQLDVDRKNGEVDSLSSELKNSRRAFAKVMRQLQEAQDQKALAEERLIVVTAERDKAFRGFEQSDRDDAVLRNVTAERDQCLERLERFRLAEEETTRQLAGAQNTIDELRARLRAVDTAPAPAHILPGLQKKCDDYRRQAEEHRKRSAQAEAALEQKEQELLAARSTQSSVAELAALRQGSREKERELQEKAAEVCDLTAKLAHESGRSRRLEGMVGRQRDKLEKSVSRVEFDSLQERLQEEQDRVQQLTTDGSRAEEIRKELYALQAKFREVERERDLLQKQQKRAAASAAIEVPSEP
eukprot:Hpha_TRINITY_DN11884_c0_g1::TRINITY_DN11884_c0_g1_i1::g.1778::m.1778